jgi:hypothetical protein
MDGPPNAVSDSCLSAAPRPWCGHRDQRRSAVAARRPVVAGAAREFTGEQDIRPARGRCRAGKLRGSGAAPRYR